MIPGELRARDQWVVWRMERRVKPSGETVGTKVPYDPKRPSHRARSTDPATWGTYRQALSALEADGLGFVFAPDDPYVGVDMDACVSGAGKVHPGAYEVVRALGGYVEFSPSGRGLHVIVRGRVERGRHTLATPWGSELAVYDRGRFFTVQGDGRGDPREAQAELDALFAQFFPPPASAPVTRSQPVSDDDRVVVDRMLTDPRIAALWAGDVSGHGDDHSTADLALCAHLAFFTGGDAARMDALFRQSGLMREKWDESRGDGTYGSQTIARATRGI